jgi:hypothetical protein
MVTVPCVYINNNEVANTCDVVEGDVTPGSVRLTDHYFLFDGLVFK